MASARYYAVLYVYEKDGSEKAIMPCFNEAEVLFHGSKYPKVKVVRDGLQPFWLSFKKEWVEEFNKKSVVYRPDDIALEWLRGPSIGNECGTLKGVHPPTKMSDQFYDGWRRQKTKF